MSELKVIPEKSIGSGWELISVPSKKYLDSEIKKSKLAEAIEEDGRLCGSCGCDFDSLYKEA